jgi:hypothetical protein
MAGDRADGDIIRRLGLGATALPRPDPSQHGAHGASNVSDREPLQVGKTVGAAHLICNASPRAAS